MIGPEERAALRAEILVTTETRPYMRGGAVVGEFAL